MSNLRVNNVVNNDLKIQIENNTSYRPNKVVEKFVQYKNTTLDNEFKRIVEKEEKTPKEAAQILFDRAVAFYKGNLHNECYNTKIRLGGLAAGFATLAFYSMVTIYLERGIRPSLTGSPIETMVSVFLFSALIIATIAWFGLSCLRFKEKTL